MTIVMAKSNIVDTYEEYVDMMLNALGIESALVTDLSTVLDFYPGMWHEPSPVEHGKLEALLGEDFDPDMYVWEFARLLKDRLTKH